MNHIAKHIIFAGRVQGVGFRFTAFNIVKRHKLTGFVRNLPNGTVEIFAQGPNDEIDDCIQNIKESFGRYIEEVKITDTPYDPKYEDFKITF